MLRSLRSLTKSWYAAPFLLAVGAARQPKPKPFADFVEPTFPFIVSTVDAGKLGAAFPTRNLGVRCVVLMLGNDSYACFDTDLLRMAVAWRAERGAFLSMTTMAQVSYQEPGNKNNAIPRALGRGVIATGVYPGWSAGAPEYRDPRPPGPNPDAVGRGPIAVARGRWNGVTVVGNEAVLSYTVAGTDVREQASSVAVPEGGQVGVARTFALGAMTRPLALVVAEVPNATSAEVRGDTAVVYEGASRDTVTVVGVTGVPNGSRLQIDSGRYVSLQLTNAGATKPFRVIAWRGRAADRGVVATMLAEPVRMASGNGGAPRWGGAETTRGQVAPDSAAYVVDRLTLPLPNRWRRNVRVADLDFFRDGRAAVVTFEGDVWIVSGIDRALQKMEWRRFASGLYEPLSIAVVRDTIYVHDRQGIVRLTDVNGDGEADVYESFSNLSAQSGESREFPLGMAVKPGAPGTGGAGFYLAIGGALDLGPKTSPAIMPGFRAGSPQAGTVQEVSADGRSIRTYARGLREPIIGIDARGVIAASDQQGNFVPSTPIFLLKDGGYYGVPATAHGADTTRVERPLLWIPHEVDQSGAGEVWVPDAPNGTAPTGSMGFNGPALVHLSYGRPGPFRAYVDTTRSGVVQGALVALPGDYRAPTLKGRVGRDGQLYLAGFSVWGSKAKDVTALVRLRYTGAASPLPTAVRAGQQGILVRFATPLDAAVASNASRYRLQRWDYVRSSGYGSGHYKLDGTPGQELLPLAAHVAADGRSVLLVVPDMKPAMQMELDYDLRSRAGLALRDTLYLTVHAADPLDLARAGFGAVDWRASARRAASAKPTIAAAPDAAAVSATLGARLYREKGCVGCHSVDGTTAGKTGPTFKGLYGATVPLANGKSRRADAAYLTQSILDPASEIVRGYEPGMPSFRGILSDGEVASLVRYIRSLGGR